MKDFMTESNKAWIIFDYIFILVQYKILKTNR